MLLFSNCSKDTTSQETFNLDQFELETRNANQWCDGGSQKLPDDWITGIDNSTGECCVKFRLPVQNTQVQLSTTNYNFNVNAGSNQGQLYKGETSPDGEVTICFEVIGSHFLLHIPGFGCFVHENVC